MSSSRPSCALLEGGADSRNWPCGSAADEISDDDDDAVVPDYLVRRSFCCFCFVAIVLLLARKYFILQQNSSTEKQFECELKFVCYCTSCECDSLQISFRFQLSASRVV